MNPSSGSARPPPSIRACGPEELGKVLELWTRAALGPGATVDAEALRALLSSDPEALLVAEAEGWLVGGLIVGWDGWRANMYRLAVHPDHRRRGIARQLIRAAEESARARGARRISPWSCETTRSPEQRGKPLGIARTKAWGDSSRTSLRSVFSEVLLSMEAVAQPRTASLEPFRARLRGAKPLQPWVAGARRR